MQNPLYTIEWEIICQLWLQTMLRLFISLLNSKKKYSSSGSGVKCILVMYVVELDLLFSMSFSNADNVMCVWKEVSVPRCTHDWVRDYMSIMIADDAKTFHFPSKLFATLYSTWKREDLQKSQQLDHQPRCANSIVGIALLSCWHQNLRSIYNAVMRIINYPW